MDKKNWKHDDLVAFRKLEMWDIVCLTLGRTTRQHFFSKSKDSFTNSNREEEGFVPILQYFETVFITIGIKFMTKDAVKKGIVLLPTILVLNQRGSQSSTFTVGKQSS